MGKHLDRIRAKQKEKRHAQKIASAQRGWIAVGGYRYESRKGRIVRYYTGGKVLIKKQGHRLARKLGKNIDIQETMGFRLPGLNPQSKGRRVFDRRSAEKAVYHCNGYDLL